MFPLRSIIINKIILEINKKRNITVVRSMVLFAKKLIKL